MFSDLSVVAALIEILSVGFAVSVMFVDPEISSVFGIILVFATSFVFVMFRVSAVFIVSGI